MEVTFTLTTDDWVAGVMYREEARGLSRWPRALYRVNRWSTYIHLSSVVASLLVPILGLLIGGRQLSAPLLIVPLVVMVVIGYHRVASQKSYEDERKRQLRRQVGGMFDSELGEQRLKLTEQELIRETPLRTSAIPWSTVDKIVTTVDHALFIRSNLVQPYVLPKRAFPQEADFTAFVEAARSYQEAARRDGAAVRQPEAPAEAGFSRLPGGEMEVVYKLTREDVDAQTNHTLIHNKHWRGMRQRAAAQFVLGVILLIVALYLLTDPRIVGVPGLRFLPLVLGTMGGTLVSIPLVVLVQTLRPQKSSRLSANPAILALYERQTESTYRLRLTQDSLIHAAADAVTATPWAAVEKIVTTTDHAFFHTAGPGIIVLPRRAFGRESEFTEFSETAVQRRRAAS